MPRPLLDSTISAATTMLADDDRTDSLSVVGMYVLQRHVFQLRAVQPQNEVYVYTHIYAFFVGQFIRAQRR